MQRKPPWSQSDWAGMFGDFQMSNGKRGPWLFRVYRDEKLPNYVGIFHKPLFLDPYEKQPGFNGKYLAVFFFRGSNGTFASNNG